MKWAPKWHRYLSSNGDKGSRGLVWRRDPGTYSRELEFPSVSHSDWGLQSETSQTGLLHLKPRSGKSDLLLYTGKYSLPLLPSLSAGKFKTGQIFLFTLLEHNAILGELRYHCIQYFTFRLEYVCIVCTVLWQYTTVYVYWIDRFYYSVYVLKWLFLQLFIYFTTDVFERSNCFSYFSIFLMMKNWINDDWMFSFY